MKKKILSILTLLCMVTVLLPANITVFASTVASGTCGDNLTWTLDDSGTLTIRGTGKMAYWSSSNTPWYSSNGRIKAVIIESGVTNISDYAFYYCVNLTSVIIPDSVTRIGNVLTPKSWTNERLQNYYSSL